jgi:hypothetical protein
VKECDDKLIKCYDKLKILHHQPLMIDYKS